MNVLAQYGWNTFFESAFEEHRREGRDGDEPARIIAEHRGGYVLATARGDLKGTCSGKLRRAIARRIEPHPSVGDWVVIAAGEREKDGYAVMHGLLPRKTTLARKVAGRAVAEQVIAANVDVVFVVCAITQDVNARTLERYLTLARESGAAPVVVLTKADGARDQDASRREAETLARGAPVHVVSSRTGLGVRDLEAHFRNNATVALIGPSGVGKSTLINTWIDGDAQTVREIREDGKGRHTTTHRHLFVVPSGGLVVDTPGMREIALWDADEGVRETFDDVEALTQECRFRDCSHGKEPGCALVAAVASGALDAARVASFQRLLREGAGLQKVRTSGVKAPVVVSAAPSRRRRP